MSLQELYVIKIGGHVLEDDLLLKDFVDQCLQIKQQFIIVHGGGKIATSLSQKLGIETKMIDGRRVTDQATIDIVVMVYAGLMNKRLVATFQANDKNAIGISGADWNLIPAMKRPIVNNIDYGFVGDVLENLPIDQWKKILEDNSLPIVAPITHDNQGQLLNTNADTIASRIAKALCKHYKMNLVYCFEKDGVLKNSEVPTSVMSKIKVQDIESLIEQKVITDGMIPKINNAKDAINSGVNSVIIGNAKNLADLINGTKGTRIVSEA